MSILTQIKNLAHDVREDNEVGTGIEAGNIFGSRLADGQWRFTGDPGEDYILFFYK